MPNAISADEQRRLAHEAALVVPVDDRATLQVTGEDRLSWLNGLLTCNLAPLREGEGIYGLAVTPKGRVLADVMVLSTPGRVLLSVPRATVADLRESFERYLVMEDAELTLAERDPAEPAEAPALRAFAVHGPRSMAVLAAASAESAGVFGAALDLTGLGGAWAFAPAASEAAAREAFAAAARAAGGVVGDEPGWEALRIARGVPRFGADFDPSTYPQEAGLEARAVSFSKGCYLGQEVVCMLEMRGHVKRRLVALTLEAGGEATALVAQAKIGTPAGEEVGHLTSVSPAAAPGTSAPCALAMVKRAHTTPGAELRVGGATVRVVASANL